MANSVDHVIGYTLLGAGLFMFVYYTFWVLVLPFVDDDQPMHTLFLERKFAITIPLTLLVLGLTGVFTFIAVVMIKSTRRHVKAD